ASTGSACSCWPTTPCTWPSMAAAMRWSVWPAQAGSARTSSSSWPTLRHCSPAARSGECAPDRHRHSDPIPSCQGALRDARLEPAGEVTERKQRFGIDATLQADHLEALAHLPGKHQPARLIIAPALRPLVLVRRRQRLLQAVAEQEAGLRAVAGQLETRRNAGLGHRGEVDEGAD